MSTPKRAFSRYHAIALNIALIVVPCSIYFLIYVDAQRARIATREFQVLADIGTELSRQVQSLKSMISWGRLYNSDKLEQLRELPPYRALRFECDWGKPDVPLDVSIEEFRSRPMLRVRGSLLEGASNARLDGTCRGKPRPRAANQVLAAQNARVGKPESIGWGDVQIPVGDLVDAGRALEFFDEVLIVDGDGRVRHRAGVAAVRLEHLGDLIRRLRVTRADDLDAKKRAKRKEPSAAGVGEPFLGSVQMGEVEYLVFAQPWRSPSEEFPRGRGKAPATDKQGVAAPEGDGSNVWMLVGLARSGRFEGEVTRVRETMSLAAIAALLFGILSWPWLKLWLIDRREMLTVFDAHMVGFALLAGAMLSALVVLGLLTHRIGMERLDDLQHRLLDAIHAEFEGDLRQAIEPLAPRADREISMNESVDWCRGALKAARGVPGATPIYEVAFRVGSRGGPTGAPADLVSNRKTSFEALWVGDRDYFRRAFYDGEIAVDRVPGRDTGEKLTVFAARCRDKATVLVAARMMMGMQSPVLPEGFGYAVFDRSTGNVVFHSDDRRSLVENLWTATYHAPEVKQVVLEARRRFVNVDYDGRRHRMLFHQQGQTRDVDGSLAKDERPQDATPQGLALKRAEERWGLVVFRDVAVLDRLTQQILTLAVFGSALHLISWIGVALLASLVLGWKECWSWLWPQPDCGPRYVGLSFVLASLAALTLALIEPVVGPSQAPWWSSLALLLGPQLLALGLALSLLSPTPSRAVVWGARFMIVGGVIVAFALVISTTHTSPSRVGWIWIAAAACLSTTSIAISTPRASRLGSAASHRAFLLAAFLGVVVVAAMPAIVIFRDAQLLELDSLRAREQRSARAHLGIRSNALEIQSSRLTQFGDCTVPTDRRWPECHEFRQGVFVPPNHKGGLKPLSEERPTIRLSRLLRKSLPEIHMKPRTVRDGEFRHGEPVLRAADSIEAGIWWRPSGPASLILIIGVLIAGGIGWILTRSAAERIGGLGISAGSISRASPDPGAWVRHWDEMGCISHHLIQAPPFFIRAIERELVARFGEFGVALVVLPLFGESRAKPATAFQNEINDQTKVVLVENLESVILQPDVRRSLLAFLEDVVVRRGLPILLSSEAFSLRQLVGSDARAGASAEGDDELLRWSELFATVRRLRMGGGVDSRERKALGRSVLRREVGDSEELLDLARDLDAHVVGSGATDDALIDALGDLAEAHYQKLWSLCTRDEKLVLVHLGRGQLVNPRNAATLEQLLRRGLVIRAPAFRLMNESFARFVALAEPKEVIDAWEREGLESPWIMLRSSILVALTLGMVFISYLGLETWNPVLALLPIVAGAIPSLGRLAASLPAAKLDSAQVS